MLLHALWHKSMFFLVVGPDTQSFLMLFGCLTPERIHCKVNHEGHLRTCLCVHRRKQGDLSLRGKGPHHASSGMPSIVTLAQQLLH